MHGSMVVAALFYEAALLKDKASLNRGRQNNGLPQILIYFGRKPACLSSTAEDKEKKTPSSTITSQSTNPS